DTGTNERLDPDLRLGVSLKPAGQAVVLAYDAEWKMDGSFNVIHHAGVEVYPWSFLGLRGGVDDANPTFGATGQILDCAWDYSYEIQNSGLGDIQRLGLNFYWDELNQPKAAAAEALSPQEKVVLAEYVIDPENSYDAIVKPLYDQAVEDYRFGRYK